MRRLAAILVLACAALLAGGQAHAQKLPCELIASAAFEEWIILPGLERCAAEGDSDSEAVLGMIHLGASSHSQSECPNGQCPLEALEHVGFTKPMSVETLYAEGFRLLRAAAAKNNPMALNELGNASLLGEYGAAVNYAEAREWLLRATDAGDDVAPYNLAKIYFGGMGVEPSVETGVRYLRMSEHLGYRPARCTLLELAKRENTLSGIVAGVGGIFGAFTGGIPCQSYEILDEIG